jgi:RimJ/RimL family protein N-acetyltransferase
MLRARTRSASQTCRRGHHVLLTAHLRLQTPSPDDVPILCATASDPEAQRWLGWPARQVVAEPHRDRLLAMEPGEGRGRSRQLDHWLLAVDRASGLAAGGVALDLVSLEVGGWLAPGFRAHGLGAELFAAIAEFGHDHLGVPMVRAGTEQANMACVAALLAAGFEPAQGPATHRLPDGRIILARWFRHDVEQATRCQRW